MILIIYRGRKETKQQNTTTHTESVIRHRPMRAIRIRVTKRVNIVGYFRCSGNAQIASLFTVTGIGIFYTFGTPYM